MPELRGACAAELFRGEPLLACFEDEDARGARCEVELWRGGGDDVGDESGKGPAGMA